MKKYLLPLFALAVLALPAAAHGYHCNAVVVRQLQLVYPFQSTVAVRVYAAPSVALYAAPSCPMQAAPKREAVPAPKPAVADPVPVVPVDPPACPSQQLLVQGGYSSGYSTARIVRFNSSFYGHGGHQVLLVNQHHFSPAAVNVAVAGGAKVKVKGRAGAANAINVNVAGGGRSIVAVKQNRRGDVAVKARVRR